MKSHKTENEGSKSEIQDTHAESHETVELEEEAERNNNFNFRNDSANFNEANYIFQRDEEHSENEKQVSDRTYNSNSMHFEEANDFANHDNSLHFTNSYGNNMYPQSSAQESSYTNETPVHENALDAFNRREKILSFLFKEQYQITHPDLRPFINEKHAYECLLPYHIFSNPTCEDLLFLNSSDKKDLFEDVNCVLQKLEESLNAFEEQIVTEDNIILDILLLEEEKFIYKKIQEFYNKNFPEKEEEGVLKKSPKIDRRKKIGSTDIKKRRETTNSEDNTILKLKVKGLDEEEDDDKYTLKLKFRNSII